VITGPCWSGLGPKTSAARPFSTARRTCGSGSICVRCCPAKANRTSFGMCLVCLLWAEKAFYCTPPTKESRFTSYFIGGYRQSEFEPEARGKLDLGGYFYAGTTFADAEGRRIAIGWLKERRSREASVKVGWCGCLSLPRSLSLTPGQGMKSEPISELRQLRHNHRHFGTRTVTASEPGALRDLGVRAMEIVAEFELGTALEVGLRVPRSPQGEEEMLIGYNALANELYIDATNASMSPDADNRRSADAIRLSDRRHVKFHMFVDHSVIEACVNGSAITTRVYPLLKQSRSIGVFAKGGAARLVAMDLWDMRSIW